ncbi:MAG: hypothetical protein IJN54_00250, partial [Lachnospiraceae bacterium]|nr:hypothetical protein [Lachnospiraceae bacterium]
DEETFDVMSIMVNQKDLVKYKQKNQNEKGDLNMCKAIDDIREEGREEGELKLGMLISQLLDDGRTEDAKRAASDENARKELYMEYGIVN